MALLLNSIGGVQVLAAGPRPSLANSGDAALPPLCNPLAAGPGLDRITFAVDGAESSHGTDAAMWRSDMAGPEGPMQVTAAAATDVGGGNRFDILQNRVIGRAYLAKMFLRYCNWPDAVAAYNWGPGNMDAWIREGRPPDRFLFDVRAYQTRVLQDSLVLNDAFRRPDMITIRLVAASRPATRLTDALFHRTAFDRAWDRWMEAKMKPISPIRVLPGTKSPDHIPKRTFHVWEQRFLRVVNQLQVVR
jgi:hypothetical protein